MPREESESPAALLDPSHLGSESLPPFHDEVTAAGGTPTPGVSPPPWSEANLPPPPASPRTAPPSEVPALNAPTATSSPPPATEREPQRPFWRRSHLPLIALVVAFALGYFFVSWIRFQEFYGYNWDLGINMQALWSTTHGQLLYESGDFETTGVKSLLSIHSTYIGVPVAYLYALAPGAATLFALQAAVVAFSAVPLYLIGRKAGLPEGWLIAGLSVYLLTFTISSAILYDFHWEAFLPAEFAWTYYLWTQRRYLLAFVPAVIGVLTLEVFPFLLVGMVLYFAYPSFRKFVAKPAESLRAVVRSFRNSLSRAWPLIGLFLFALVSYVVLRVLQHDVIPAIVGTAPKSLGAQVSLGYTQLFGVAATSQTIAPSLVYWFLLFAAFGFIPLLVRQSVLLLSLPWFWASVFVDPMYSSAFGNQYAFVALATIAVAFVEGLAIVHQSVQANDAKAVLPWAWFIVVMPFFVIALLYSSQVLRPTLEGETLLIIAAVVVAGILGWILVSRARASGPSKTVWRTTYAIRDPESHVAFRRSIRFEIQTPRTPGPPPVPGLAQTRPMAVPIVAGVLVIVVLSNLALSPFSPANSGATVYPGYRFSTTGNPAYGDMGALLAQLPANATIVASDNLFPFVADDVNAYSLLFAKSTGDPFLPFSSGHLPDYVLLSMSEWSAVPTFLKDDVFNQSDYRIVSTIYSPNYPESVYLFSSGYQGATNILEASPFPNSMTLCPSDFSLGASGRLVSAAGTACGSEIESVPASNLSGNGHTVWFGPYMTLLPGHYIVTMSLKGGLDAGKPDKTQVVLLNAGAYGVSPAWYSLNLNATKLKSDSWTNITVQLNVTWPVSGAEFRGYLGYSSATPTVANGFIDLNFVELTRVSSSP